MISLVLERVFGMINRKLDFGKNPKASMPKRPKLFTFRTKEEPAERRGLA